MNRETRKLTLIGMFCALAYIITFFIAGKIQIGPLPFLRYDPKDIIITICGLVLGPISAVIVSFIVSFLEMITMSDSGIIGMIMNVVSTCAFVFPAVFIYKKKPDFKGLILGLFTACISMTAIMILWNYAITPIYMNIDRDTVVSYIVPAFLPFNLIKSTINAVFIVALYKPLFAALNKSKLLSPNTTDNTHKLSVGLVAFIVLILASATLVILSIFNLI